jgi:hypothetical protein
MRTTDISYVTLRIYTPYSVTAGSAAIAGVPLCREWGSICLFQCTALQSTLGFVLTIFKEHAGNGFLETLHSICFPSDWPQSEDYEYTLYLSYLIYIYLFIYIYITTHRHAQQNVQIYRLLVSVYQLSHHQTY